MDGLFGDSLPICLAAQVKEVQREIALRRRVYPRLVEGGRMTQAAANRQIAVMEAVLFTLEEKGRA